MTARASVEFLAQLDLAPWHHRPTPAGQSFLVEQEAPALYAVVGRLLRLHGRNGMRHGFTARTLDLGGYTYWCLAPVLTRERLPGKETDGNPEDR